MKPTTMEVWKFIAVYKHLHDGLAPTLREIGEAVFLTEPAVSRHVVKLASAGIAERDRGYARGIILKRLPAEFFCPCCNERMRVIRQPAMTRQGDVLLADCQNFECDLFQVTLTLGEHRNLTPEQIASYGRAARRAVR